MSSFLENNMSDKAIKIDQFFNANNKISREVQSSLPVIIKSLENGKFKYTSKALLSSIPKSGYLNSAILELSGSKNIYAAGILSRSMIEHNFRHLYIYVKALNDNDNIGKRYYIKRLKQMKIFLASYWQLAMTFFNSYVKVKSPNV